MKTTLKALAEGAIQTPVSVILAADPVVLKNKKHPEDTHVAVVHMTRGSAVRLLAATRLRQRAAEFGGSAELKVQSLGSLGDSIAWMRWNVRSGGSAIYSWSRESTFFSTSELARNGTNMCVQEQVGDTDELYTRRTLETIEGALERGEIAEGIYAGDQAEHCLEQWARGRMWSVEELAKRVVDQAELGFVGDEEAPLVNVRWIPQSHVGAGDLIDHVDQAVDVYHPLEVVMRGGGDDLPDENAIDASFLAEADPETLAVLLRHQGPSRVVITNRDEVVDWINRHLPSRSPKAPSADAASSAPAASNSPRFSP